MHTDVQFSVLGPVRLHKQGADTGTGQPRQCAVLTSLLLRAGGLVSLSALVEGVWGQDAPASAVGMLILATLTNVFYSLNVSSNWQLIARGVIVVDAVGVDAMDRLSKRG